MCKNLKEMGFDNVAYHAGMSDAQRHENQERFMGEDVNIIVATVAFGMGIDRSNIRFVIHAGMPKSIEHYQQETGRAGRDWSAGVLLYVLQRRGLSVVELFRGKIFRDRDDAAKAGNDV